MMDLVYSPPSVCDQLNTQDRDLHCSKHLLYKNDVFKSRKEALDGDFVFTISSEQRRGGGKAVTFLLSVSQPHVLLNYVCLPASIFFFCEVFHVDLKLPHISLSNFFQH